MSARLQRGRQLGSEVAHLVGVRHQHQLGLLLLDEGLERGDEAVGSVRLQLRRFQVVHLGDLLRRNLRWRCRRRRCRRPPLPASSRFRRRWPARRSASPTKRGSVCLLVAQPQPGWYLPLPSDLSPAERTAAVRRTPRTATPQSSISLPCRDAELRPSASASAPLSELRAAPSTEDAQRQANCGHASSDDGKRDFHPA